MKKINKLKRRIIKKRLKKLRCPKEFNNKERILKKREKNLNKLMKKKKQLNCHIHR